MSVEHRPSWPPHTVGGMAVVDPLLIAMAETTVGIVTPGIDATLSKQPTVHLLPAYAIMLDDRLIRYAEGTTCREAPIRGVELDRRLLECFAGAAEGEEALGIEVGKNQDEDIQR